MALIRSLIGFVFVFVICGLAVMNRGDVQIAWSPIHDPYTLPLYVIILSALGIGFFAGGFLVWVNSFALRIDRRRQKKQVKALEKELETVHKPASHDVQPIDLTPALPNQGSH